MNGKVIQASVFGATTLGIGFGALMDVPDFAAWTLLSIGVAALVASLAYWIGSAEKAR